MAKLLRGNIMNNPILKTLFIAFISIVTSMPAKAANRTWSGSSGTDFENSGNWDALPANDTTSDIAVFGPAVTGNKPSLTKNRGISGMVFQSTTGGWSLGGSFTITNGASGIDDSANTGGTDTINANVILSADQTWTVGAGGNLVVNGVTKIITGNRTLTNDTGTVTLSSLDADNAARGFTKRGTGILVITGAAGANLQGRVYCLNSTIIIGNKSALGLGPFSSTGGTLQSLTDLSGANAVSNNWELGGNITFSGQNNITMAGNYPGANGTKTLTSSLDSGKTLILSGSISLSSDSTSRILQLAGTGNTVISGVISNGGTSTASSLTIQTQNTGTNTITGANAYGGTTSVYSTSIVIAGNKTAFGAGILTLNSVVGGPGAILQASTDLSGPNALSNGWNLGTVGGGVATVSGANNITLAGDYAGANGTRHLYNGLVGGKTLTLSGTIGIASDATDRALYIEGTGDTTISGTITNNAVGGSTSTSKVYVASAGITTLSGANTYGGVTTVSAGTLRLSNVSALPGGIGSTGGAANLSVSGGAVIELAVDNFYRPTGTSISNVNLSGGGGFSAYGANRVVNLGGATGTATWASTQFIGTGYPLVLNSSSANAQVDFQNPIALGNAVRTIQVNDNPNTSADQAMISGVISSSTAGNGLVKTGAGTLILSATNTYSGPTTVSNGVLLIHGATTNSAITVVSGGTLGGTGNVGLVSVNANGAISANGTNTIGVLTATNLTVAENAIIYWNYDATTADLINVTGALSLPTNATVYVSGTGALPSNRQMFSLLSGTIGGPATLKWTFIGSGIKATTHAVNYGTHVSLVTSSGTIITLQ
jgi:autotransporter-associated beta strand protein